MYTSDRSEVDNYVGAKLTRGRFTPKFCLLVTSKAQVGLCGDFHVPWNPSGESVNNSRFQVPRLSVSSVRRMAKSSADVAKSEVLRDFAQTRHIQRPS